jgi:hypothetical protein
LTQNIFVRGGFEYIYFALLDSSTSKGECAIGDSINSRRAPSGAVKMAAAAGRPLDAATSDP